MPAAWVRQARDRITRASLPAAQDRRVFIARRHMRRVANMAQVEGFLAQHGFVTVELEDLSFSEQVRLFIRARWVVGVHGAGLANLLFCQPGTKVLELSPDTEYRPFFAYLSGKLGLDHAVLPCATAGDHFNGDLQVDLAKFTALFRMLRHRLRGPA